MPHQYGLSTRTGTEAVSRLLRAATEACPRATILSVDAVGAFDHVSRGAMLGALLARRELHPLLPFARQFYSSPSVYTWCDDDGCLHEVSQGEGGEQGDPLMPAFYALAQHDAICDLQRQLRDGEAVFAFLDDIYIVALPERIRAARAAHLVQLGELSAAAHALTAAPQAPGNTDTLAELRDPERRPPAPQVPLSAAVLSHQPDAVCPLPESVLLGCLRGARRGSAAGPSGATSEHLDPADGALLHRAAERLANADVPEQVLAAVRLGRMVALRKPNGRVRALVVGDVFRRLVARALAQHFAAAFQEACLPYQFGLSTRAGTEGLYKLLHTATALDARATVLSVDAVGAYDHVSRQAMCEGLRSRPALAPLLPFARQFYGSASVYTWLDETGTEHDVLQGDGGEQGDPLMPALFSLAQHAALSEAAAGLQEGEAIFAFLDDTYVVSAPERTVALHGALEDALWRHARIRLNQGKTRVWNAAGEEPADLACLQPTGAEPVWTGAWSLPADQQGLLVLGAPLGSEAFVQQELHRKRETQDQLLTRLPAVGDLQSAWLLLLFCASPRANYLLRMLPPGATARLRLLHASMTLLSARA